MNIWNIKAVSCIEENYEMRTICLCRVPHLHFLLQPAVLGKKTTYYLPSSKQQTIVSERMLNVVECSTANQAAISLRGTQEVNAELVTRQQVANMCALTSDQCQILVFLVEPSEGTQINFI